jgi:hypothetical protein
MAVRRQDTGQRYTVLRKRLQETGFHERRPDSLLSPPFINRSNDMHTKFELPKAFSVRDEHEFLPIQHLLARLNPRLLVKQVATGVHVDGGGTVFWGLVYLDGEPPSKKKVEIALREAGFDFAHNVLTQAAFVGMDHLG